LNKTIFSKADSLAAYTKHVDEWTLEPEMLYSKHRHSPDVGLGFSAWIERMLVRLCCKLNRCSVRQMVNGCNEQVGYSALNLSVICCVSPDMKRSRLLTGLGLILALTLASCGVSTQPIDEALPATGTQNNPPNQNPPGQNPPTDKPPVNMTLSSGTFVRVNHATSGTGSLIKLSDGSHIVRLEGFETDQGPDVRVWVSESATLTDAAQRQAAYTDLAALKSLKGNQNYTIPKEVDISKIKSIVIWCRLASVAFGGAVLK
jgi:Electron transfer DM13